MHPYRGYKIRIGFSLLFCRCHWQSICKHLQPNIRIPTFSSNSNMSHNIQIQPCGYVGSLHSNSAACPYFQVSLQILMCKLLQKLEVKQLVFMEARHDIGGDDTTYPIQHVT